MAIERLGPYQIDRVVGHGGMGTVYAGTHLETGETAAIKVLSEALCADPRFRERFQAEVDSQKRLRHPNIVTLYGYGAEDDRLFFTMELVDGPSLESELRQGKRFDWKRTAEIGIQICAALKHAHDHGIIHRDLKPGNLLLATDGTVKLTDFGIAKTFGGGGLTLAGSMIGTPEYMAPEQTEGAAATPRSDLYSLGCVLYAMMVGEPPFWNPAITKLIDRVRHETPVHLRMRVDDVPQEFDRLIDQLLSKRPEDRVSTPQLLANLLQSMLHALSSDTLSGHATSDRPIPSPASQKEPVEDTSILTPPAGITGEHGPSGPDSSEMPTQDFSITEQHRLDSDDVAIEVGGPATEADHVTTAGQVEAATGTEDEAAGTRYTTVSKAEWKKAISREREGQPARRDLLMMGALVLGLIGIVGVFIYALTPPSADHLYQEIRSTEDLFSDKYAEQLEEFLSRYPDDPRGEEVQGRMEQYQCQRLRRELQNKLRSLKDAEQLYLDGMSHLDEGNDEKAAECFREILGTHRPATAGVTDRKLIERATYLLEKRLGEPIPEASADPAAPSSDAREPDMVGSSKALSVVSGRESASN